MKFPHGTKNKGTCMSTTTATSGIFKSTPETADFPDLPGMSLLAGIPHANISVPQVPSQVSSSIPKNRLSMPKGPIPTPDFH